MRVAIVTVLMSLVLLFFLASSGGPLHFTLIGGAVVIAFVIAKLEARSWARIRQRRQNA